MTFIEFEKKFPTEKAIVDYYIKIRYKNNIVCPHCNSNSQIYRYKKRIKIVKCNNCNNTFSVFTGTIFEHTSTALKIWFYAIHLFLNAKKGISGCQLQREIGVTYKCAWRILYKLREAMGNVKNQKLFKSIVEIDETYVGGKPRREYDSENQIISKSELHNKRGRGTNKTPVVGIKERNSGIVYARVMYANKEGKKLTGRQLIDVLDKICKNKTTVITDDFRGYDILNKDTEKKYKRFMINHSEGYYSNGDGIHTNGIESFWSTFKRSWYGIYHHISIKYLQNYVNECCFRNNHRMDLKPFDSLLKQVLINITQKTVA
jgi:transposase-like protein